MDKKITIRKAPGNWTVRAGGAVIGESSNALELSEGDLEPVIYFPRSDIAMAFQQHALYPHMTVRDNMTFALKLAKKSPAEIDAAVVERVIFVFVTSVAIHAHVVCPIVGLKDAVFFDHPTHFFAHIGPQ